MKTVLNITVGEIGAMITNVNQIQLTLNSAAGCAVMVELRMRLIGEHSQFVRAKLIEMIDACKKKNPKKPRPSANYWDCDLVFLDDAIAEIFRNQLDMTELQKLGHFRKLRNKLLHADFVGLMEELGIPPTSRNIVDPINGKRSLLVKANIKEAVLSVSSSRNRGLQIMEKEANEVVVILDKLLYLLAV